ncbi:MAG: HAMP domain-containing histidine kinase [Bacteroidales bacterium]|nr:HAMP domain-containing histidine kinase [Bacteroidales bacterium]
MVFKSFRFKVILRLLIITSVIVFIIYFIAKPYYYFTVGELLLLVIALIIELIRFIEKGHRQINQMLESLKERDFSLKFNPVEEGKVFRGQAKILTQLVQSYRDIRIEKEMHYQFLNLIVNQLNYGIVCFDADGKISLSNKTIKKLCGLSEISHISSLNRIDKNLSNAIESLKTGEEKLISVIKDGEFFKYSISCNEIRLLDSRYKLVALHNLHSTLQEHELDSHKKLIRILTHEIMNSVTPILSLSESMNENLKDESGNIKELNDISKEDAEDLILGYEAIEVRSRALMRFVNDFRSLTRLPDPKIEVVEIDSLFRNVLSLYRAEIDEKGIKLSVYITPDIETISVDRGMLEQVLINLIKNSIEALEDTFKSEIVIESLLLENSIAIVITDNGKGISPENLEKVFIPFFSTKKDGSGIGLSLSQHLIHLMGGTIGVKSIQGLKTSFSIRFPI